MKTDFDDWQVARIFLEIRAERKRQDEKWGEQNHPMLGTPIKPIINGKAPWPSSAKLKDTLEDFRCRNKTKYKGWFDILLEEICEAFLESDPERQRVEMVQVAAVAVAIIECLDRRIQAVKNA